MYQDHRHTGMFLAFLVTGILLAAAGALMMSRFRDQKKQGFQDFGVGPRGALWFLGLMMTLIGVSAIGVSFVMR